MAIGMQRLSPGSGHEYLTRQVAAMDATGRGHSTLSDYYSTKGESPSHWHGDGLEGVGLEPGDPVTKEQMKLLFGASLNPGNDSGSATRSTPMSRPRSRSNSVAGWRRGRTSTRRRSRSRCVTGWGPTWPGNGSPSSSAGHPRGRASCMGPS